MEILQKKYTVESLATLISQDSLNAFEEMKKMPDEEVQKFLLALPLDAYGEIIGRAMVENLNYSIENKVETP